VTGYHFLEIRPADSRPRKLRSRERYGAVCPAAGVGYAAARAFADSAADCLRRSPEAITHVVLYDGYPPVTLVWERYGPVIGTLAQVYRGHMATLSVLLGDGGGTEEADGAGIVDEFRTASGAHAAPRIIAARRRPLVVTVAPDHVEEREPPLRLTLWAVSDAFFDIAT
jgi:hypothetical protein